MVNVYMGAPQLTESKLMEPMQSASGAMAPGVGIAAMSPEIAAVVDVQNQFFVVIDNAIARIQGYIQDYKNPQSVSDPEMLDMIKVVANNEIPLLQEDIDNFYQALQIAFNQVESTITNAAQSTWFDTKNFVEQLKGQAWTVGMFDDWLDEFTEKIRTLSAAVGVPPEVQRNADIKAQALGQKVDVTSDKEGAYGMIDMPDRQVAGAVDMAAMQKGVPPSGAITPIQPEVQASKVAHEAIPIVEQKAGKDAPESIDGDKAKSKWPYYAGVIGLLGIGYVLAANYWKPNLPLPFERYLRWK